MGGESRPIVKHPLCFSKKIKIFAALQILIFFSNHSESHIQYNPIRESCLRPL